MNLSNLNLAVGQTLDAWRQFRPIRQQLHAYPAGSPILITGAYRSGTTWLGKLLSGPGIWALHEPFNPNKGIWKQVFSYASPDSISIKSVDKYVHRLLNGHITIGPNRRPILNNIACNRSLMPARLGFYPSPPNRILIKDPIAALLSGYLTNKFEFQTLVIIRHPGGFVSSLNKLNWEPYVRKELDQFHKIPELMGNLSNQQVELFERRHTYNALQVYTLVHAVLNKLLLGFITNVVNMHLVSYESLCLNTEKELARCYRLLNLELGEEDKIRHVLLTTRSSNTEAANPYTAIRNSKYMADIWKQRLTERQLDQIRSLWIDFGINYYNDDAQWEHDDSSRKTTSTSNGYDPASMAP